MQKKGGEAKERYVWSFSDRVNFNALQNLSSLSICHKQLRCVRYTYSLNNSISQNMKQESTCTQCMYVIFGILACKKRLKCIAISLYDLTQNRQKLNKLSRSYRIQHNITHSSCYYNMYLALLHFHTLFFAHNVYNIPLIIIHREFHHSLVSSLNTSCNYSMCLHS